MQKSIGVDLVELKKITCFYENHSDRLPLFLSRAEVRAVRKSKKPEEELALFLAAKEAVFKMLGRPWMGRSGFRDIRISKRAGRLSFRVGSQPRKKGSLSFVKNKSVVCVECRGHALGSDRKI